MQAFKRNFLQHHLAVCHWLNLHRASGHIDAATLRLRVACEGRNIELTPQFSSQTGRADVWLTPTLQPGVSGFVGWLPYFNKRWEHAIDKLAYKRFLKASGIATPAWSQPGDALMDRPYLIKGVQSTLGRGMSGPHQPPQGPQPQDGQFCEQFIEGDLVKAWYWDGELQVVEQVPMPSVTGDGRSTLAQLAARRIGSTVARASLPTQLLALRGLQPTSVPRMGQRIALEFRYNSPTNPANGRDHNVREAIRGKALEAALQRAGRLSWMAIPAGQREGTAFTLDGVVDEDSQLWLLEINCNPLLHPAFYAPMLDALFQTGAQEAPIEAASANASA